jgi:HJR/Mrr/RecB family endonuclease
VTDAADQLRAARVASARLVFRVVSRGVRLVGARLWLGSVRIVERWGLHPLVAAAASGAVVGLAAGCVAIVVLRAPLSFVLVATLIPTALLMALTHRVFARDVQSVTEVCDRQTALMARLKADWPESRPRVTVSKQQLADAKRLRDGVARANENPLLRLLNADLSAMTGSEFETYLADVFRFLGYQVQHIGQTGDQGVDLIVSRAAAAGPRVAVQAKCYAGSVSNAAVQQAYTGMRVHGCDGCAVVTSSYFTASAKEAAAATGCLLVEGPAIRELIRGRIPV